MSELQTQEVLMGGFVLCSLLSLEPWDVGLGLGALPALQRLWCGVLRHSKPRCVLPSSLVALGLPCRGSVDRETSARLVRAWCSSPWTGDLIPLLAAHL